MHQSIRDAVCESIKARLQGWLAMRPGWEWCVVIEEDGRIAVWAEQHQADGPQWEAAEETQRVEFSITLETDLGSLVAAIGAKHNALAGRDWPQLDT